MSDNSLRQGHDEYIARMDAFILKIKRMGTEEAIAYSKKVCIFPELLMRMGTSKKNLLVGMECNIF